MLVQLAECLEVSVEELLGTPKSDSTAPKPPEELLADKLGQLTAQLAQQNTRRRRFWKGVAIAAGAGAVCLLPPAAIAVWFRLPWRGTGNPPFGRTGREWPCRRKYEKDEILCMPRVRQHNAQHG